MLLLFSLTIVPSSQRDHCMLAVADVATQSISNGCSYDVLCSGVASDDGMGGVCLSSWKRPPYGWKIAIEEVSEGC